MMDAWSRRRAAVAAETRAGERLRALEAAAEREARQADKSDAELLEELGLPEPETLNSGEDFRQFLAEAVPARLKNRALRHLWRVNPVLANLDGLVDYGEDFTDAATILENMQSAYQVGKGMFAHVEELQRQAEAEQPGAAAEPAAPAAEKAEAAAAGPELGEPEDVAAGAPLCQAAEQPADMQPVEQDAVCGVGPGPRRMIFTFDDQRTG